LSLVVMGLVRSIFCCSSQFRPGQPSFVWVWKIYSKNLKFSIFNFFPLGKKNIFGLGQKVPVSKMGQLLIYCRSKVCLGWVWAHLYSLEFSDQSESKLFHQGWVIFCCFGWFGSATCRSGKFPPKIPI